MYFGLADTVYVIFDQRRFYRFEDRIEDAIKQRKRRRVPLWMDIN